MAIAFVKHVGSGTSSMSTTTAVTVPAAGVASGTMCSLRIELNVRGTVTVADTQGNTWTERKQQDYGSVSRLHVFDCAVGTTLASGNTITATHSKGDGQSAVDQWSGVGAFVIDASATGTSTTPSSGAITTGADSLVLGVVANAGTTYTEDADSDGGDTWHTLTAMADEVYAAYKIPTSGVSQTYNITLDASHAWAAVIAEWAATTDPRVPRRTPYPQLLAH